MPDERLEQLQSTEQLLAEAAKAAHAKHEPFCAWQWRRPCDCERKRLADLIGRLAAALLAAQPDARQEVQHQDSVRLGWFERNADNLLVRRFDDGTFAFFARPSRDVPFPAIGHEPWQDLRTAIDTALHPAVTGTT
jgi:hypothetical protein